MSRDVGWMCRSTLDIEDDQLKVIGQKFTLDVRLFRVIVEDESV